VRNPCILAAALLSLWAGAPPAVAQSITDGDTLKLNGVTYRLWGIDAPETKQWCGDYPAGVLATATLETLMKGRGTVICEAKDTDRYGRTVAVCRVDGRDLGKAMVELGMAWAFTRYSHDYVADEERAKRDQLGVHGRGCLPAWDWRAAQRR
jgi:endonuclease YncB( thermonuclease family)